MCWALNTDRCCTLLDIVLTETNISMPLMRAQHEHGLNMINQKLVASMYIPCFRDNKSYFRVSCIEWARHQHSLALMILENHWKLYHWNPWVLLLLCLSPVCRCIYSQNSWYVEECSNRKINERMLIFAWQTLPVRLQLDPSKVCCQLQSLHPPLSAAA